MSLSMSEFLHRREFLTLKNLLLERGKNELGSHGAFNEGAYGRGWSPAEATR